MLIRGGFRAVGVVAAGVLLIGMTASALPTGRVHAWDKSGANATTEAQFEEISIEAFGHLREFVCHHAGKVLVDPILTPLDSRNARFKKVRGLADAEGVSFESTNEPGKYLRHQGGHVLLERCPEVSDQRDATFLVHKGASL